MNFPITAMSARGLALQVLLECRKKEAFVQDLLDQKFRQSTLSLPDRRLATQLVYGVLRRRGTLDALLGPKINRELHQVEPWIWEILRLGAFQLLLLTNIPPHAALNESVELAIFMNQPRAKGFINAVLRSLLPLLTQDQISECGPDALPLADGVYRKLGQSVFPDPTNSPVEYLAQAFSLPDWLVSRWLERYGWQECMRLGFWFAGPAPLTLRINPLRCERELFMQKIDGVTAPGIHPQSVRLRSHVSVADIPGFTEGHFVVQDDSAMRVASALAPDPGQHILDMCAAPGGKTTHLAELMGNRGRILACDVEERKLQPLKDTCLRLGLTIIETKALDTRHNEEAPAGLFDAVLADVPCSNTGVLGRRPEVRWRLKPSDLVHLANLQARLLHQGCERVRPGGKIVYSTCSIEPEENQMVVHGLLRARQDFNLEAEETNIPGFPADGGYWARLRRN